MENNPIIPTEGEANIVNQTLRVILIVNQVMPQYSMAKDLWLVPVLKNLLSRVNISQNQKSSVVKPKELGIRFMFSMEFCHKSLSCVSVFISVK